MGHELKSVGGFPTWYDLMPQGIEKGHWTYSASHALRDFFQHLGVRELWLPDFYCPDTVHFLAQFFKLLRYGEDQPGQVGIPATAQPGQGIVYYPPLGQTQGCCLPTLGELQARQLQPVLDLVHDLHAAPHWHTQGWNTVVSYRKFYPVPYGARLLSEQMPANAEQLDRTAVHASEFDTPWLTWLQPRTEGYSRFKQHEAQLHRPDATLAAWVPKMIASLNEVQFQQRRQSAYQWLSHKLDPINQFFDATGCGHTTACAPIAYPFYQAGMDSPKLRQHLATKGIFIPQFWPGLKRPEGPSAWHDCLLLPTGPLLSPQQLDYLLEQLLSSLRTLTKDSP